MSTDLLHVCNSHYGLESHRIIRLSDWRMKLIGMIFLWCSCDADVMHRSVLYTYGLACSIYHTVVSPYTSVYCLWSIICTLSWVYVIWNHVSRKFGTFSNLPNWGAMRIHNRMFSHTFYKNCTVLLSCMGVQVVCAWLGLIHTSTSICYIPRLWSDHVTYICELGWRGDVPCDA